jgi:hypothetical protein
LGILLGISSFTSSFIKNALLEDVRHVDLFVQMGDVHITFVILIHCFMQQPSYLLQSTPPFSTFIESLISFDFSFFQRFEHLLGLESFDNPERPLAHKQVFFPITFGGIGLIPMATITSSTYLRSWALVASIVAIRFMVDQHPFLFEALT